MLSRNGVIIRYILWICCFFLSGSKIITDWPATICGVIGTIELATALLRYSPLVELNDRWSMTRGRFSCHKIDAMGKMA